MELWHSAPAQAGSAHAGRNAHHASQDAGWGGESSRRPARRPELPALGVGSFGGSTRVHVASHSAPLPLGPKTAQEILSAQTPTICNMPAHLTVRGLALLVIVWNVFRSALLPLPAHPAGYMCQTQRAQCTPGLSVHGLGGVGSYVSLAMTDLEKAMCVLSICVYAVGLVAAVTSFSAPKVSSAA